MPVTAHEIVKTNLVLVSVVLLNKPEETERFQSALDADLREELGITASIGGMPEPTRTVAMNRDRITLTLSTSRTSIEKEYPSHEDPTADFARLAQVAHCAIASTTLDPNQAATFGYNLEAVFHQDSEQPPLRYLGNRLFNAQSLGEAGWELTGGTGQLIFADPYDRQWTITMRPRSNDERDRRVVLALNLHLTNQPLPSAEDIRTSLTEVWTKAKAFMERLDQQE